MPFTERRLSIEPPVEVAGRQVKRYHVTIAQEPVEPDIVTAAMAYLPELLAPMDTTPPAAFIVLHRGRDAVYLNAYSWVWDNVLHCRTASAGSGFLGSIDGELTDFHQLHHPWIGCVWELPPLAHERSAWVRHMLMPPQPQMSAYLADALPPGPVGAP
jgi:hypothetical protein